LGLFYFFKHTKFEITCERLVQKKFCEQKNLHFLILKKSMGTDFLLTEKLILFTKIKLEKNFYKKSIHMKAEKLGYKHFFKKDD
jgi:hypothetical protein